MGKYAYLMDLENCLQCIMNGIYCKWSLERVDGAEPVMAASPKITSKYCIESHFMAAFHNPQIVQYRVELHCIVVSVFFCNFF